MATAAILKSFLKILEELDCIAEDQSKKGDARSEANNIANKIQEREFIMLNFWNEILKHFLRVSQVLQNEDVNLKNMWNLCGSLADQLYSTRWIRKIWSSYKGILPDVDYKAVRTRKRIKKKEPNDGDAPEVYLNARDKFRITTFYTIVDKLETEMWRKDRYTKKYQRDFIF